MDRLVKIILKPINSISKIYKNISVWGKVIILIIIFLIVFIGFKKREGFEETDTFLFKSGTEIYDKFYAEIYDYLVYNNVKNEYEIGEIVNATHPTSESIILDIGCGLGHHVAELNHQGYKSVGVDNSLEMIKKAKENYPDYDFIEGDVMNAMKFQSNSYTHILCLYFTLYYFKDKLQFFKNCFKWLMPGGCLVVHIVDRDFFDPIIPPANPLLMLTPQRYAKERITDSNVTFDDFKYNAKFELNKENNTAKFVEKFKNKNNGKVFRKNEHLFYMEPEGEILSLAKDAGFIIQGKIDLVKAGYEYCYDYILVKPE